jgi:hypothetical protein
MARQWGPRLERWQTLLAAGITAAVAILVAEIGLTGGNGSDGPTSTSLSKSTSLSLSVTSWTETPATPPPGKQYAFFGTVSGLPEGWAIFVVAEPPHPPDGDQALSTAKWLVSPRATVTDDEHWSVDWRIEEPPAQVRWTAVVHIEGCSPGEACFASGYEDLELSGPNAAGVRATAVAPSH